MRYTIRIKINDISFTRKMIDFRIIERKRQSPSHFIKFIVKDKYGDDFEDLFHEGLSNHIKFEYYEDDKKIEEKLFISDDNLIKTGPCNEEYNLKTDAFCWEYGIKAFINPNFNLTFI